MTFKWQRLISVHAKILAACFGFVAIIATVGGLAQQQAAEMGRLAISIYDHAFMGMSYVDQAQAEFLRLKISQHASGEPVAADGALQKVLTLLDVALERVASDRTRDAGKQTRGLLASLPETPPDQLAEKMTQADKSLTKLVKKYAADGLETRDDAESLTARSTRMVLIQVSVAIVLALGVGFLLGRNLSRPLIQLVRNIDSLAAGNLDDEVPARLARRRDEIGGVARATAVFRLAMQQNARADEERAQQREHAEQEKQEAMQQAADKIEQETGAVAERSVENSTLLAGRAEQLAASAARMMGSVDSANGASSDALHRCEMVAAAGEELSSSAREIARQLTASSSEIADTARAGEQARHIIDTLSASMEQIGSIAHLIGDIAGRTNLLALNATIEAARAGEAGRGFAVVAGEVKNLANQTASSTQEIARAVAGVQSATGDAVKAVREMVGRLVSIEHITSSIAAASEEQTAATGEIARNVLGTVEAMREVSAQIEAVSREAEGTDAAVAEMRSVAGAVTEQMVRIVRTSSDAANRRHDDRIEIGLPATLVLNGNALRVTCLDIGLGGARVRCDQALAPGAGVVLRLSGLPDLAATVIAGGPETGVQFNWQPGAAPAALAEWINGRRAA